MSTFALLVACIAIPLCFGAGVLAAEYLSRQHWRERGFCPACGRFEDGQR